MRYGYDREQFPLGIPDDEEEDDEAHPHRP